MVFNRYKGIYRTIWWTDFNLCRMVWKISHLWNSHRKVEKCTEAW